MKWIFTQHDLTEIMLLNIQFRKFHHTEDISHQKETISIRKPLNKNWLPACGQNSDTSCSQLEWDWITIWHFQSSRLNPTWMSCIRFINTIQWCQVSSLKVDTYHSQFGMDTTDQHLLQKCCSQQTMRAN